MATFTSRTVTITRREFLVPAGPFGAPAAEINKAWAAADQEYRKEHGVPQDQPLSDDAIVFRPGDDEIVISFEKQSQA